MNADILIKISFNIADPDKTVIRTNARKEALEELLSAWVYDQMGRGGDNSTPEEKDIYQVVIGFEVAEDIFATTSDTGNKGLTAGLVMDTLRRLDRLSVEAL